MRSKTVLLTAAIGGTLFMPIAIAAQEAKSPASALSFDSDDIAGVVKSAKGPEAGVWVIAETTDLPTSFVKSVVTDDQGRYVIPDLPKAKFKVWVRGYGLVDSKPVDAQPGASIDLTAVVAPSPKAAAEYYPAAWWYSMLKIPPESEFGTGAKASGISPAMKDQQHWINNAKEQCLFCHQVGNKATRELEAADQVEAWNTRVQMNGTMNRNMTRFGRERGLAAYADWTTRVMAGDIPATAPKRPVGIERNIVVTVRGWGGGDFIHDQISSDRRNPTVNAGGPIYGMGMSKGELKIIDPNTLKETNLPIPSVKGGAHNPRSAIHANEMDGKGRVWMASVAREGADPGWCRDGSVPSSKYFPLPEYKAGGAILPVYDPKSGKIETIPLCVGGNHSHFTFDKESTLWLSGDTEAVGWINTRIWDETKDIKKATGWCPMVVDTNGDGKIDPDHTKWNYRPADMTGGGENVAETAAGGGFKIDPAKDTRIAAYLYNMGVGKDGIVWQGAYVPTMPSAIVRLDPGKNPPSTCKAEIYEPPMKDGKYLFHSIRGVNVDADGIAWAAASSGHVASFDRRKCKVTNGPTALGQQCPEGWKVYDLPSPKFEGSYATADMVYNEWTDYHGVAGLGPNAKFFPATNSDSIVAMADKSDEWVTYRVPYPMGFYTRGLDFRIDDPKAGWKGKTMQAASTTSAIRHHEDGDSATSKIVTFQVRPNPLAH